MRGFHVREDVAPLKLLFADADTAADGNRFHVREDVAPLKREWNRSNTAGVPGFHVREDVAPLKHSNSADEGVPERVSTFVRTWLQ